MLNFGAVYTFFKGEFLRNEHRDPLFSYQSTRDMMSFVCAKFKKKIRPLEEFVIYVLKIHLHLNRTFLYIFVKMTICYINFWSQLDL